ncbi:MAG: hypothetical protein IPM29_08875 [Planctomycetes bacterium]|nr:hypothetical protein [Planctomycetota bacterium]
MRRAVMALLRAWLIDDFFGVSRRRGDGGGSSLTTAVFGQSFLAFVVAVMLVDSRIGGTAYAAANLSLSTVLVGLGATASVHREARRRADRLLLSTAPVPRATGAVAHAAHGAMRLTLLTIGVALPPAILIQATDGAVPTTSLVYVAVAIACAALLAGGIELATRAADRLGGPLRAALVAGVARALLLAGAFAGFATCAAALDESVDALPGGRTAALAWPPYWAARLVAAGDLRFGLALLVALCVLSLLALLSRAERGDVHAGRLGRPGPTLRLAAHLAGPGPVRGATVYAATMLYRSPGFRARVLPLLGLPLAMALIALDATAPRDASMLFGILLQLPAIYTPLLVAFLPFVEGGSAAVVFRTSPGGDDPRLARAGALIALTTRLHLPVLLTAGAAAAAFGLPVVAGLTLAAISLALAVAATAIAVQRLDGAPFTSDRESVPPIDVGQLLTGTVLLGGAGAAVAPLAGGLPGAVAGLGALGLAWRFLRRTAAAAGMAAQEPPR